MRNEPFEPKKKNWDNDDICYALDYHPQTLVTKHDIQTIVAEVCGENDGADWYWVVKRKDGKFVYVSGGCDYTGWDCQSGANSEGPFDTADEAARCAPEKEEYYVRYPRQALLRQLEGSLPFAVYTTPEIK